MYELSDEDEKQIAIYCARATAKYNLTLQQGALNLIGAADDEVASDASDDDTAGDIDTPAPADTGDGDTASVDADAADDGTSDSTGFEADTTDTSQDSTTDTAADAALRDAPGLGHALGVPELKFSFERAKDVTNYSFDGYFDLSPASGNHFLVLEYQVFNSSDEDIDLNVPAMGVSFRATVDGAANTSDRTILLNDISSFNGTIKARKKQDMVMLFQFDPAYLKDLSDIQLQVISGEEKILVDMR